MLVDIESVLKGTRRGHVIQEWLTNSVHFPLANIILELLLESPSSYLLESDLYVLLAASLIQAHFLGSWRYQGSPRPFLGNLIAPTLYTATELIFHGSAFFSSPNHLAYWGFSLAIGSVQQVQSVVSERLANLLILMEHLIRTCILLAMYWIFETLTHPQYTSLTGFLADDSHVFVITVVPLLGLIIGFAHLTAGHYLIALQKTAVQLRKYSEWLLGRELLARAISDINALSIQRQQRSVLFMDIRGFTHWAESRTPEQVITMLNAYFETAEEVWEGSVAIKVKYTGDEVMAVFPSALSAVQVALELREKVNALLQRYGLAAGIGVHQGEVVEGLIGSTDVKAYDVIGDTVNTGKRISDQSASGELLISHEVYAALDKAVMVLEPRSVHVKGKSEPLQVYPLEALIP